MSSRYATAAIVARLKAIGYVYESDLAWLEKRGDHLRNYSSRMVTPADEAEQGAITAALDLLLTPCPGEAHGNAYIDNCGVCAPRWGKLVNPLFVLRNSAAKISKKKG